MPEQPLILCVSGAPASGKSSIASALAAAMPGFALLEKDRIKEALFDALELGDRETAAGGSRRLSDAAMRVLWALAPNCPRVILEANFRTKDVVERERFAALPGRKVEVYCRCSPEEAARRFAVRAGARHPVHTLREISAEVLAEFDQPFGLSPVVEVDTERVVDLEEVLGRIRKHWPGE